MAGLLDFLNPNTFGGLLGGMGGNDPYAALNPPIPPEAYQAYFGRYNVGKRPGVFDRGTSPIPGMEMAGVPMPTEQQQAPQLPPSINIPQMQVASAEPTDMSSVPRRAGPPMQIAPQLPQQQPSQLPQQAAGMGIGDRFINGLGNNSNMLMGAGAALLSGEGFGGGLRGAMTGSALDKKNSTEQAGQIATYKALIGRGMSPNDAMAAVLNPEIMKTVAAQTYGEKKAPDTVEIEDPNTGLKQRAMWDAATKSWKLIQPAGATTVPGGAMAPGTDVKKLREMQTKDQFDKQNALPDTLAKATQFVNLVDMAITHPGRETYTGASGYLDPRNYMPGTDAKNYGAIHKQLTGQAFMEAYAGLRGGGAITEVEGKKATEAQIRLDTAQSDEAYLGALKEARQLILDRMARAKAEASGGKIPVPIPPQPSATPPGNVPAPPPGFQIVR
jgi:hypothetical protein